MNDLQFGVGLLRSRDDNTELGLLQEVTVAFAGDLKVARGGDILFPVEGQLQNRGITISASYLQLTPESLNKILGGNMTLSDGLRVIDIEDTSDVGYYGLDLYNPSDGTEAKYLFWRCKFTGNVDFALVRDDYTVANPSWEAFVDDTLEGNPVARIILPD